LEPKNCSWQEPFLHPKLKTLRMVRFIKFYYQIPIFGILLDEKNLCAS